MDPLSALAKQVIPIFIRLLQHLDPQALKPLASHLNKVVCFDIEHFEKMYFKIEENGLVLIPAESSPDVVFTGPLSAFLSFALTQKLTSHGLHIRGDLDCAKAFYDVWEHLDIDWEGHLAKLLGNTIARGVYQGFYHPHTWAKETWQARQADLGAYLQDEMKILPTRNELDELFSHIDQVRDAVDRLEVRINRLHFVEKNG